MQCVHVLRCDTLSLQRRSAQIAPMMLKQMWTESGREIYHLSFWNRLYCSRYHSTVSMDWPTSLLLHWDGYLIQFLLSYVQIVILCPNAVVLCARTMFRALATVRDRTIVLPVVLVKLSSVLPLTSNHGAPENSPKSHWLGWTTDERVMGRRE